MIFKNANKSISILLLFLFALLIFYDFTFPLPSFAQNTATKMLKKGIMQFENAEFDLSIITLRRAIQLGLKKKSDRIEAHKYLAFCLVIMGEKTAKDEFLKILAIDKTFELPVIVSPKYQKILDQAKQEFAAQDRESPTIIVLSSNSSKENLPMEVKAEVTDRSGVKTVTLHYKKKSDKKYVALPMTNIGGNLYSAFMPSEAVTLGGIDFYITAKDKAGNEPSFKGTANHPNEILVAMVDENPPVITHMPVRTAREKTDILIKAKITDRSGIEEANLFYRKLGETEFVKQTLKSEDSSIFTCSIPAKDVTPNGIEYYLCTKDKVGNLQAYCGNPTETFTVAVKQKTETPDFTSPIKPPKKKSKRWWIYGLSSVVVGGGIFAAILFGGKSNPTSDNSRLPDPPTNP